MCLGIPGEIMSIEQQAEQGTLPQGLVSFAGVRKQICLAYVPEASVGDFVIVHAGFALGVIDPEQAREVFALLAELEPDLALETRPDPETKAAPESKPGPQSKSGNGTSSGVEARSAAKARTKPFPGGSRGTGN